MRRFIYIVLVSLSIISCSRTNNRYYESGELKCKITQINDSVSFCTGYYKNGVIKDEGYLFCDSLLDGHWKEYYADGVLKWEGEYERGHVVFGKDEEIDNWINKSIEVDIENDLTTYQLLDTLCFRLRIKGIHPDWYAVSVSTKNNYPDHEILLKSNIEDCVYPFQVTILPKYIQYNKEQSPYIEIIVFFMNKDGLLKAGGIGRSLLIYLNNLESQIRAKTNHLR